MGGDGEVLRHRGLKSSSLRLGTSKLWWGSGPRLGRFRLDNAGIRYSVLIRANYAFSSFRSSELRQSI